MTSGKYKREAEALFGEKENREEMKSRKTAEGLALAAKEQEKVLKNRDRLKALRLARDAAAAEQKSDKA